MKHSLLCQALNERFLATPVERNRRFLMNPSGPDGGCHAVLQATHGSTIPTPTTRTPSAGDRAAPLKRLRRLAGHIGASAGTLYL